MIATAKAHIKLAKVLVANDLNLDADRWNLLLDQEKSKGVKLDKTLLETCIGVLRTKPKNT